MTVGTIEKVGYQFDIGVNADRVETNERVRWNGMNSRNDEDGGYLPESPMSSSLIKLYAVA